MKAKILLLILVSGIISGAIGQNSIDLTFTAVNNGAYIQLDSIKLMNRTQGDSVKLFWPDTTLTYQITSGDLLLYVGYAMNYLVGIGSISKKEKQFQLYQSYPNPVRDQSSISVYLPSQGSVNMMVADVRGMIVLNLAQEFDEGTHSLRFSAGDERIYFITAQWNGITQSIKILTEGLTGGKTCKLEYIGLDNGNTSLKQSHLKAGLVVQESGILDSPDNDTTYTFQFATNIPCPGTPTVTYEGQVYNTFQIFSQCWLKENLNVGTLINCGQNQTNNSIKEKYCYNNNPDSCTKYGGLYQWEEMMQYSTQQGAQGICPPGWHPPTDEEWKVLEGAVDSQYGIGAPEWDSSWHWRGFDAGTNLKTTSGWYLNGNGTDLFSFSGLPGGMGSIGLFDFIGINGYWWSSTATGILRNLYCSSPGIERGFYSFNSGMSVRCLRDY